MSAPSYLFREGGLRGEIARDLIALGGIPFYFLVIVRTTVGMYTDFLSRLIISIIALYILCRFSSEADKHIARGFILATFTSLH